MTDNFLLLTLFLPRVGLLIWYLQGWIPANTTPFVADLLLSVFFPRILILIWIAFTMGFGGWFWAHLIFACFAYLGGGSSVSSSKSSN
jgi:hypothetical protein